MHVEQDDRGPQARDLGDRRPAVCGLAHDRESFGLEQRADGLAEAGVVVDDEHRPPHQPMLAQEEAARIVATPRP